MENIKKNLFELLKTIHGNGSFETSGIKKITSPGLRINGIGEISLPISPIQVAEIIKISKKAPFGKGSKTITDAMVRSAWELNADQLSFHNEDWRPFIEKIVEKVKAGLGIETNPITTSLYKLLIYEEGDFFLSHKDSEKELGMFGTLIIGLPSTHTGGELVIRFDHKEKIIDFSSPSSNYKIPYVAFFADCDHEIKPITSGYRVALVYNLLQYSGSQQLSQSKNSTKVDQIASILKSMSNSIANKPKAVLLEHQYTPANFSLNSLKHHDRPRAQILLEAARKVGYFAELGLVTHYKMGALEGAEYEYNYYSRYRHKYSQEPGHGTLAEVFEEYTIIEHWSSGGIPTLGEINIEKEDLITDFEVGEGNPIQEEEEGYTGNAGMTTEYWYHYGAIIFWPKNKHLELLSIAPVSVRLKWLEYYYQNWDNPALNPIELSKLIITGFAENELTEEDSFSDDFSIVATILLKLKNETFILEKCEALLAAIFKNIHVNNWTALLQHYEPILFKHIFESVATRNDVYCINHILEILKSLNSIPSSSLDDFLQYHIQYIPTYLENIQLSKLKDENRYETEKNETRKKMIIAILEKVIALSECKEKDTDWINRLVEIITKSLPRNYVNNVLIIILENKKGILVKKIKQLCILNLTERTAVKPNPPANWKRNLPDTKNDVEVWNILAPFLESADAQIFEYKKAQSYRSQMESAINRVTIDLKMETIAKGSPHVLKITKTQAAYERQLKKWHEDMAILKTL
jgi:predicted 2-oxoglutarate/Fe(II)-dependent dioxygenase YbiX